MMADIALSPAAAEEAIVRTAETAVQSIGKARAAIQRVIYGQDTVVDLALITILAGGHGLLVGVPGLAKTKLVETLTFQPRIIMGWAILR